MEKVKRIRINNHVFLVGEDEETPCGPITGLSRAMYEDDDKAWNKALRESAKQGDYGFISAAILAIDRNRINGATWAIIAGILDKHSYFDKKGRPVEVGLSDTQRRNEKVKKEYEEMKAKRISEKEINKFQRDKWRIGKNKTIPSQDTLNHMRKGASKLK